MVRFAPARGDLSGCRDRGFFPSVLLGEFPDGSVAETSECRFDVFALEQNRPPDLLKRDNVAALPVRQSARTDWVLSQNVTAAEPP